MRKLKLIACVVIACIGGATLVPNVANRALGQMPPGTKLDSAIDAFAADVYPSQRKAVTALVEQLTRELGEDHEDIRVVSVGPEGQSPALDPRVSEPMLETLRTLFPKSQVISESPREGDGRVSFVATVSDLRAPSARADVRKGSAANEHIPYSGRVTVRAIGEAVTASITSRFVEKPWADDWNLYRNAQSGKRYLMAESSQLHPSEEDALASARRVAVDQLAQLITETMNTRAKRTSASIIKVSKEWVRERIASSLRRNPDNYLITDTFVQKFARPYGDVWRASLLVDATPANINKMVDAYNIEANAQTKTRLGTFGAVTGMGVVVVLLYAFLNAVTKGYFTWRLRAVAVLAMVAGVIIAFAKLQP